MELCERANCDHMLFFLFHLRCDVRSLLKSSTLLFLDVGLYLQSNLALSEIQYLEVYHANQEHGIVHVESVKRLSTQL